jgi:hypothetical protein
VRIQLICCLLLLLGAPVVRAEGDASSSGELVHRIIKREHDVAKDLERFHPIVETYVQVMNLRQGELALSYDRHFVSLAEFAGGLRALRFKPRNTAIWRNIAEYSDSLRPTTLEYDPSGFVAMAYPDPSTFDLEHYRFQYLTREFLGEVRCFVFQVTPSAMRKGGLFEGKVWVEDQDLTIVRFNGIYKGSNMMGKYFHFDSWRVNAGPGRWLPAAIYSGETGLPCCGFWKLNWTKIRFKARTTFWGYDLHFPESEKESAKIIVDPSSSARDEAGSSDSPGPIVQLRAGERQGEDNLSEHLERVGLLSPAGDVEKTLQAVVNSIEVTNNLSIEPEIRCRVLLTSNLESAVVGHTIILSRGLIDVLPDETTLAAVLAHNLAHIALEGYSETKFSWPDELTFGPRDVTRKLRFVHSPKQDEQASSLAREWMSKSPYKDSLGSVTRFVAELRSRSRHIDRILEGNIGESLYDTLEAGQIRSEGVALNGKIEIRALSLGSRIAIDPWSDKVSFLKAPRSQVYSQSDDLPFEVTPVALDLQRIQDSSRSEIAFSPPAKN